MATAPKYANKWPIYAKEWDNIQIKPNRLAEVKKVALRLYKAKDRYLAVEKVTGVPWYFIACVHERESSQRWDRSLAQGDRWDRPSIHVPAGRGPFSSWEAAAIDALQLEGLSSVKDWRLEKILYYWERYNGWGYYAHNMASPYVWGASNIQVPGKYIADGKWSYDTLDTQIGCATLLKELMELDNTIAPVRET